LLMLKKKRAEKVATPEDTLRRTLSASGMLARQTLAK
jgi:hypothetical protein